MAAEFTSSAAHVYAAQVSNTEHRNELEVVAAAAAALAQSGSMVKPAAFGVTSHVPVCLLGFS